MNHRFLTRILPGVVLACIAMAAARPALAAAPTQAPVARSAMLRGHETELQKNRFGLGLTGGVDGSTGFAYRHYFGNFALQLNALPLVADRGDYLAIFLGAQVIDYMLVWTQGSRSRSIAPSTTALRLVGNSSVHVSRSQDESFDIDCGDNPTVACKNLQNNSSDVKVFTSVGAGFGFEFGAIMRPGFSVALDLVMTVRFDNDGFYGAYPLPHGTLMYSW